MPIAENLEMVVTAAINGIPSPKPGLSARGRIPPPWSLIVMRSSPGSRVARTST